MHTKESIHMVLFDGLDGIYSYFVNKNLPDLGEFRTVFRLNPKCPQIPIPLLKIKHYHYGRRTTKGRRFLMRLGWTHIIPDILLNITGALGYTKKNFMVYTVSTEIEAMVSGLVHPAVIITVVIISNRNCWFIGNQVREMLFYLNVKWYTFPS